MKSDILKIRIQEYFDDGCPDGVLADLLIFAKQALEDCEKESEKHRKQLHRSMQLMGQMTGALRKERDAQTDFMEKLVFEVGFMSPPVADSVCTAIADFKEAMQRKEDILANIGIGKTDTTGNNANP